MGLAARRDHSKAGALWDICIQQTDAKSADMAVIASQVREAIARCKTLVVWLASHLSKACTPGLLRVGVLLQRTSAIRLHQWRVDLQEGWA